MEQKSTDRKTVLQKWIDQDMEAMSGSLLGVAASLLVANILVRTQDHRWNVYTDVFTSFAVVCGSFTGLRGIDFIKNIWLLFRTQNERD